MTTTGETMTFADVIVRLSHVVDGVFADVAREFDLTPQQTQLLCMLEAGPIGMGELSRLLHLEKSSMSGLVDRVERRGLVTRVRDPRDRRAYNVALTEHGAELATKSHGEVSARIEALTDQVPRADRARVASVLTRLLG